MCKIENAIVEAGDFGITPDGEFIDVSYYGIGRWESGFRSELSRRLPHFEVNIMPTGGELTPLNELIALDVEVQHISWEYEVEFHQEFKVRTKHFNDGTFYYTVEYETGTKGTFFHKTFCKAAYSVDEVATIVVLAVTSGSKA